MKQIKEFPNYMVDKQGNIKNCKTSKTVSQHDNGNGYMFVNLWRDGKRYNRYVHRLVAETYIVDNIKKSQVNHIDGNKKNNAVSNLEFVTGNENIKHAVENGLSSRGTIRKNNSTGYVGVHKMKSTGKYQAHIKVDGKSITVGYYDSDIDAAIARDEASIIYHGNTGKLNFPILWG